MQQTRYTQDVTDYLIKDKAFEPVEGYMDVTPDIAAYWLQYCNVSNIRMNKHQVEHYTNLMKNGQWHQYGEALLFTKNRRLLNGQKRLTAVCQSGTTQQFRIAVDVPPEVFASVDTGATRSLGQILSGLGFPSATQLGSCLSTVARMAQYWENGGVRIPGTRLAHDDLLQVYLDDKDRFDEAVRMTHGLMHSRRFLGSAGVYPVIAYFTLAAKSDDPAFVHTFWRLILHGASGGEGSLPAHHPCFAVRERLQRLQADRDRKDRFANDQERYLVARAVLIKAWNAYCTDSPVHLLDFRGSDHFPIMEGLDLSKGRKKKVRRRS